MRRRGKTGEGYNGVTSSHGGKGGRIGAGEESLLSHLDWERRGDGGGWVGRPLVRSNSSRNLSRHAQMNADKWEKEEREEREQKKPSLEACGVPKSECS